MPNDEKHWKKEDCRKMTQIINKKLYNMKSLYAKKLSMYDFLVATRS